jgi:hypothetical protein
MSHPQNLILLKGGLGNQLFQYSFFHLLKKNNLPIHGFYPDYHRDTYGRTLEINKVVDGVEVFNRPADGSKIFISENFDVIKNELLLSNGNIVIRGYFQNYGYVKSSGIASIIKTPSITQESTALHIRRGDYGHNGVLPIKYYLEALKMLSQPKFVIFTDEPNFALYYFKKKYQDWLIFSPQTPPTLAATFYACAVTAPSLWLTQVTHGSPHTWRARNAGQLLLRRVSGRLTAPDQDTPLTGKSLKHA